MMDAWRKWLIRLTVLIAAIAMALDTMPATFTFFAAPKNFAVQVLQHIGLEQGEWPLFAPNPVLNNGWVAAEVEDHSGHRAAWNSPDWENQTVWQKFYRFRHMNFYQRLVRNGHAISDFLDYLQRSIPQREMAESQFEWSEDNTLLEPQPLQPPIAQVRLYHYRRHMSVRYDQPLPNQSETIWVSSSNFLTERIYSP